MKTFLVFAKIAMAFVWGVLALNLVYPFPGITAIVLYIMTVFLFMMHGLQALIFIGAFGDKLTLTRGEKWGILIFGVFALLDIRQKHMQTDAPQ
uniref:DUF1145 domain-containing protein n=1 Tax=Thaumasiovibrio occultus TaxID=1891184 RepID=UPI000B34B3E8|nr:DUF1145 domain-containing protein [Thaumasiovibrio occultus]